MNYWNGSNSRRRNEDIDLKKKIDNLTACAIAAEKMGMSYGNYMALGFRPEGFQKKRKPDMQEEEKVCPVCGKSFPMDGLYRNRIYCSEECRKRRGIEKYMDKYYAQRQETEDRYCVMCGKAIPKSRHGGSKTCSIACSSEYAHIKKLEYDREKRRQKKENGNG